MKIILVFTVYLINQSITMIIEVHLLEVVHCEGQWCGSQMDAC
jgi:hypothetical protein